MAQQNSQENTDVEQKVVETSRKEDVKPKDNQMLSKMKKKRKSTVPKLHGQNNKQNDQKQIKQTQMWKKSNALSESLSKNNTVTDESLKGNYQQQLEYNNKKIIELRKERDERQKKCNDQQNESKGEKFKVKDRFRQTLLQLAKTNRMKRAQFNANYGYFNDTDLKDSNFVEGPYLKELKNQIREKQKQIEEFYALDFTNQKKYQEAIKFKELFLQKQLGQLNLKLVERQKVVEEYRENLKNGNRREQARPNFLKHTSRQIKIQKSLHHTNIVKFLQIIKSDESQVIFAVEYCQGSELSKYLRYCQGSELSKYLRKCRCIQQKQAKIIIKQIFCLKYLQDNKPSQAYEHEYLNK